MDEFKIEKNVRQDGPGRRKKNVYPFMDMEVGDSILVPNNGRTALRSQLLMAAKTQTPRDRKHTTSSEGDGVRIWRVE